jgi:hypothetical protein
MLHRYMLVAMWLVWWVKEGIWWGRIGQRAAGLAVDGPEVMRAAYEELLDEVVQRC